MTGPGSMITCGMINAPVTVTISGDQLTFSGFWALRLPGRCPEGTLAPLGGYSNAHGPCDGPGRFYCPALVIVWAARNRSGQGPGFADPPCPPRERRTLLRELELLVQPPWNWNSWFHPPPLYGQISTAAPTLGLAW